MTLIGLGYKETTFYDTCLIRTFLRINSHRAISSLVTCFLRAWNAFHLISFYPNHSNHVGWLAGCKKFNQVNECNKMQIAHQLNSFLHVVTRLHIPGSNAHFKMIQACHVA